MGYCEESKASCGCDSAGRESTEFGYLVNFTRCPRSRLKVWSLELGSIAPSRTIPLIFHTEAEYGACLTLEQLDSKFYIEFIMRKSDRVLKELTRLYSSLYNKNN